MNAYLEAERLGEKPKGLLYAAIAACHSELGDEKKARKYIEWAVQFNPENDYVKQIWSEYEQGFGGPKEQ